MGSWVSYGLGRMNQKLPAYVVVVYQGTGKNRAFFPLMFPGPWSN
jgi:hypothetical protein